VKDLFPITDNIFKYLLTVGIALLFFALIYPLQKQQQVELQRNEALAKERVLGIDISVMESNIANLKGSLPHTQHWIDSIKKQKTKTNSAAIDKAISDTISVFERKKQEASTQIQSLQKNQIQQESEREKIKITSKHIWQFFLFKMAFIVIGAIFTLTGLYFWLGSAYIDDAKKGVDYKQQFKSNYVRFGDLCMRHQGRVVIILLILAGIVAILFWLSAKDFAINN
jgi:hypothetical protein